MRGSLAKRLRRQVYGTDNSPAARSYVFDAKHTGTVFADPLRRAYQNAKGRGREVLVHIKFRDILRECTRKLLPFLYSDTDSRKKERRRLRKEEAARVKKTGRTSQIIKGLHKRFQGRTI